MLTVVALIWVCTGVICFNAGGSSVVLVGLCSVIATIAILCFESSMPKLTIAIWAAVCLASFFVASPTIVLVTACAVVATIAVVAIPHV